MKKPLVILEMANNHMGDINHGKKIITEFFKITKKYNDKINFAFKFQYRDQENFIHINYKNSDHNGVSRFESTFFNKTQWKSLISFSQKKYDLICTPFDEISVVRVFRENFKFLKIASCSSTDWPLLEEIAKNYKKKKKKIIASLAGLTEGEISKVISFFNNKKIEINYLYCVGKYPSQYKDINLSFFNKIKKSHGSKIIGFSSHEIPSNHLTPSIAYGAGVRIFEKHVGIKNKKYKLNQYSLSTKDLKNWLDNLTVGIKVYGSAENRNKNLKEEIKQLNNFKRGVYIKKAVKKNDVLKFSKIDISYPATSNQVKSNDLSKFCKIKFKKDIPEGKPLMYKDVTIIDKRIDVIKIRDEIRNFLVNKKVIIPKNSRLEISHHYGIQKFFTHGITMINVINSKYCKKLIIMLPGQKHPEQYHKVKEESFFILNGEVELKLQNKKYLLKEGMLKTIYPNIIHEFYSKKGCIIEELSTTSKSKDSFYIDKNINLNKNRKSFISLV